MDRKEDSQTMSQPSNSRASLAADLRALGVGAGQVLMVHAAFRSVGWTEGGPATLIRALQDVLGPGGTLVMPAASPQLGRVAGSGSQPDEMFDPAQTPTQMGYLAETFRQWPETLRSDHPLESVCARGAKAAEIVADHATVFCEGAGTPFEKLYTLDGWTLLLGVGFNRCTSLHYAEFLSPRRRTIRHDLPLMQDGKPGWVTVSDMAADNSTHFLQVGARFVASGAVRSGRIGSAPCLLFSTRAMVACAVPYFNASLDAPRSKDA